MDMALFNRKLGFSANRKSREVAYVRHGKDEIRSLGDGFTKGRKISTVWVTTKDGKKWEIPVDSKTGRVTEECLYAMFLDVTSGTRDGSIRNIVLDMSKDAEILHEMPPGGFTPKQLVETGWLQAMNESDIKGIDDTGALEFAQELEYASATAKGMGRKMVFRMPPASADKAREIIARDFNAAEVKRAVKNGGIIIKEGNPGRGAGGCYLPIQQSSSLKTPVIILRPGWDEETLVHEFTHHLRFMDDTRGGLTRTPHKLNERGEWVPFPKREENSASNLEEAATVAESLVRIQSPSVGVNGYYSRTSAHGDTPRQRYDHDRRTLAPEKPMRGRRAEKQVVNRFDDTSISRLGYYRPGDNASNYYTERKTKGTLPVANRPVRKKRSDMTKTTSGPIGATAMKSYNRAYTKAKR